MISWVGTAIVVHAWPQEVYLFASCQRKRPWLKFRRGPSRRDSTSKRSRAGAALAAEDYALRTLRAASHSKSMQIPQTSKRFQDFFPQSSRFGTRRAGEAGGERGWKVLVIGEEKSTRSLSITSDRTWPVAPGWMFTCKEGGCALTSTTLVRSGHCFLEALAEDNQCKWYL